MSQQKYKAIVSDIDGTLTPIVSHALPTDKVTKSIQKAVKNGIVFCLATGRPYSLIKYIIDHLGPIGPCIVDNGAVIANSKDGSVLWEAILPNTDASGILKLLKPLKLFRASCDTGLIENPQEIPNGSKVRKMSIHDIPMAKADELIDKIEKEFKDVSCAKASSYMGDKFIDVYFCNINATKQFAVFELAKILNIDHKEMIGVGDSYNDFPLLMACGLKVAMGNSIKEILDIADYVAPSVDDDGLADVIEKFCK